MFAIIDIETCGTRYEFRKGRITEICIVVHDGLTVVDKFTTLINPECNISPYFINITGITNDMVRDAPKFHEVAKKILEMTENCVFVAHNVGFDYGFIKEEFASLGYTYKRETLCTVRMSRKLIPDRISYSLGHLCAALGIGIEGRHRAEGDAVATAQLFDLLLSIKSQHPQYKNMGVVEMMARRIDKIKKYVLDKLPESCGVYYFLDKEGKIIYIGKSTNMYQRAISHFNNPEKKSKKMLNDLYNVDYVETGSELIALLLESEEIKKNKPKHNRARKASTFTHSIDWWKDKNGVINFKLVPHEEAENPLKSFSTYFSARECLDRWIEEHTLCMSYCNLTDEQSSCFNHQIKKCNGICSGEEEKEIYNERADRLIKEYLFREKDFIILDKGRNNEERAVILIEDRKYAGFGYIDQYTQAGSMEEIKDIVKLEHYYPDTNDLIRGWCKKNKYTIVDLNTGKKSKVY